MSGTSVTLVEALWGSAVWDMPGPTKGGAPGQRLLLSDVLKVLRLREGAASYAQIDRGLQVGRC